MIQMYSTTTVTAQKAVVVAAVTAAKQESLFITQWAESNHSKIFTTIHKQTSIYKETK